MALQTINIDDRNFDQLLEELKKHIPVSQWTDHHPSDPGIMLLELFAWLGEMALYQMDQVPESHREKFLKLIMDPPEPVTVDVTLSVKISKVRTEDLSIPAGTRFATDFNNGKRYIFETYREHKIPKPKADEIIGTDDITRSVVVNTGNYKEIKDEILGKSDGAPNQIFPLKEAPVLLDFVNAAVKYQPNPVVKVGGVQWDLKQFLLIEESQAPGAKHFMVEGFENQVRFGDDKFAAIPLENETVTCSYRVLQGPEALIKSGELKHILDDIPGLNPGEIITLAGNTDALGSNYFVEKETRFKTGLENSRDPYRLITAEDFEHAILFDFNQLQDLTRKNEFNELPENVRNHDIITLRTAAVDEAQFDIDAQAYFLALPQSLYKIFRVSALMNRKLKKPAQLLQRAGHVTLLVIPEFKESDLVTKNEIQVHEELENKILDFLDKRRLITTHLHIMPAALKKIDIKITVAIFKERSSADMEETIANEIKDFMDILTGGFDNKGWPTGKNLYKSHLYRLVEGIDGVDYVKSLTLSPSVDENCIQIGENELPLLRNLAIYLERS